MRSLSVTAAGATLLATHAVKSLPRLSAAIAAAMTGSATAFLVAACVG